MGTQPTKLALAKIRTDGGTVLEPEIVAEYVEWYRSGGRNMLSPKAWFADFTFVGSASTKERIERECLQQKAIAFIDLHPEHGYVFHTLMLPGGEFHVKECSKWFIKVRVTGEAKVEKEIAEHLAKHGQNVRRQVGCPAGRIDILTDDAVYEVEETLSRAKVFEAVGQALLYRESIARKTGMRLRAVIAGKLPEESKSLLPLIESIGVEVLPWNS